MYSATELYPNAHVTEAVNEYSIAHSTPLPDFVNQHRAKSIDFATRAGMDPGMMVNTLQVMLFPYGVAGWMLIWGEERHNSCCFWQR